ncbi:KilA-N domain-containing protein [Salmonella enterica subsp. enterica serovar Paratyphi C str. CFSAN000603]|uniref:KilA-N domain-containing protein n=3 Tax=Salmonella enterica TaxID=28901 RepID=A0A753ZF01_SALER|nr:KilA-N domain-containing protein [Salmonella enterica subsp. enterica serovar Paratyphi C str. CFSAN000603]QUZ43901.1 KilA-N domain-containing protein [Salmonella enterica subsp. enterica serovar Paratyphi B str. CFSAN000549]HAB6612429.1 KilA-N domain-containing protein [Salmonella enterica subsp. enterica serovar Paratyphi C]HAE8363010.1 KilA-N domain-containing protein [Salmonella enterica subsp. enterica serovar Paratyphi B]HAF8516587.1 KilA-N domain-containing protein [Salmonella enteric
MDGIPSFKITRRKEVAEFKRRVKTRNLINSLESNTGIPVLLDFVGNTPMKGTWAHPDIALAYTAVSIIHQF